MKAVKYGVCSWNDSLANITDMSAASEEGPRAEVGWVNAIWRLDWWRGDGLDVVERAVRALPATR